MLRRTFSVILSLAALLALLVLAPPDSAHAGRAPQCLSYGFNFAGGSFYNLWPNLREFAVVEPVLADNCPGPPAAISFVSRLDTATCGSSLALNVEVVDAGDYYVKDGTLVTLATSLGSIQPEKTTKGGTLTASLQLPTKVAGVAEVVAVVNGIAARTSVQVSCS
jgi:hypothetical protein